MSTCGPRYATAEQFLRLFAGKHISSIVAWPPQHIYRLIFNIKHVVDSIFISTAGRILFVCFVSSFSSRCRARRDYKEQWRRDATPRRSLYNVWRAAEARGGAKYAIVVVGRQMPQPKTTIDSQVVSPSRRPHQTVSNDKCP